MLTKLFLSLRNNGHKVDVVKINGETRPVLGRSHPEDKDLRVNVLRQWGMQPDSPRKQPLATIDEPLPQRTQTILSHQLSPELRQRINSGVGTLSGSRQRNLPGCEGQAPLRMAEDDT
jgi:hypothetical protein